MSGIMLSTIGNHNTQNTPIDSSLLLLLDASSYTSGSVWTDESSYGNDATIFNSPTHNSNSFTLDGVDQYFDVADGFADFTNGITILSFVNFGNANNWERIIDFGTGTSSNNIILARNGTTTDLRFELYGAGSRTFGASLTSGITNNSWGFYGARLDGSTYKIFNQSTDTSASSSVLPTNITRTVNYISRSNWAVDSYFEGQVGIVAIYDRALSDSEIDAFYNTYKSAYGLS